MFKHILKIALRNLFRYKIFSLINISGLALGIACCILIFLYIQYELGYDRFHVNAKQIYEIETTFDLAGKISKLPYAPFAVAPELVKNFSEIQNAVRIGESVEHVIRHQNKQFFEKRFLFSETSLFEIFSFPIVKGNPKKILDDPHSIVITEDIANKYFGSEDPIGKILTVTSDYPLYLVKTYDYKVAGVLKNLPLNSTIQFDFLASINSLNELEKKIPLKEWYAPLYLTFFQVKKGYSTDSLGSKINQFIGSHRSKSMNQWNTFDIHPLINRNVTDETFKYIYLFSLIAIIVLLIACINFMNLSTARFMVRLKEIGVKKVFGAGRYQIIQQFLGESVVTALIALIIAFGLVELMLPYFRPVIDKPLTTKYFFTFLNFSCLIGTTIFIGILSGSYPAFYLSMFQPIDIVRKTIKTGASHSYLRKILVVFQFSISVILIIGTMIIWRQMNYISRKDPGFDAKHIVVVSVKDETIKKNIEAAKNEFMQIPGVLKCCAQNTVPGQTDMPYEVIITDFPYKKNGIMQTMFVDYDFIDTYGLQIIAGRNFSREYATDAGSSFIINEEAVRQFGLESPLGKQIEIPLLGAKGAIIGIVKDFNFMDLSHKLAPLLIRIQPVSFFRLAIKISEGNVARTLKQLEEKWRKLSPYYDFSYQFLDKLIAKQYSDELRMGKLFGYFSSLSIFIALLGLFGLTSFSTERRTKEIGIRKTIGASTSDIVFLLIGEFIKWVIIAILIACPIAYYLANRWLQNFAYRIDISWWIFLSAGLFALIVAVLTISIRVIKSAMANPVDTLKYE